MDIIAFKEPGKSSRIVSVERKEQIGSPDNEEGFLITPFNNLEHYYYSIKEEVKELPSEQIIENKKKLSLRLFSKLQYSDYINNIKEIIGDRSDWKIVASRRLKINSFNIPERVYSSLCENYPDAFVFLISTKDLGTWIGASPELLLRKEGNKFLSMALAGTRKRNTEREWDLKNLQEQKIVEDYIKKIFRNNGLYVRTAEKGTKAAGNIEHIMSLIEGEPNNERSVSITELLSSLSPTPALSGFPKDIAIETINKFEGDRFLYGGYAGNVKPNGDFSLYVILRCGVFCGENEVILFSGGGITSLSDPELEWDETEKKFETLKRFL